MGKPPIKDIEEICKYLEDDESRNYYEMPHKNHIWLSIVRTMRWVRSEQRKGGK